MGRRLSDVVVGYLFIILVVYNVLRMLFPDAATAILLAIALFIALLLEGNSSVNYQSESERWWSSMFFMCVNVITILLFCWILYSFIVNGSAYCELPLRR